MYFPSRCRLFTVPAIFTVFMLAAYLAPLSLTQAAESERTHRLSEDNVRQFLETMRAIGTGQEQDMTPDEMEQYLERHIAEKAYYESAMTFEIPGMQRQETKASLTKQQYIETLFNDLPVMQAYDTEIEIKDINFSRSNRVAEIITVIKEHGNIPWGEHDDGSQRRVPVKGTSKCEQKIVISLDNYIQMAKAVCNTLIKLDPFAGKELGEL